MGKIATEVYAYGIGGKGTPTYDGNSNPKCCTKTRAEKLGCNVSGTYLTNQLVQETSLSKAGITVSMKYASTNIQVEAPEIIVPGSSIRYLSTSYQNFTISNGAIIHVYWDTLYTGGLGTTGNISFENGLMRGSGYKLTQSGCNIFGPGSIKTYTIRCSATSRSFSCVIEGLRIYDITNTLSYIDVTFNISN